MPWPPIFSTCRKAPWTWNLIHTTKVLVWEAQHESHIFNLLFRTVSLKNSACPLPIAIQHFISWSPFSEGLHYANPSKRRSRLPPPKRHTQKMVTRYTGTLATTTNTCVAFSFFSTQLDAPKKETARNSSGVVKGEWRYVTSITLPKT